MRRYTAPEEADESKRNRFYCETRYIKAKSLESTISIAPIHITKQSGIFVNPAECQQPSAIS